MRLFPLLPLTVVATFAFAADQPSAVPVAPPKIVPSLANVPYGSDPSQVVDFYRADSAAPTPVVMFIHGGGWVKGSKDVLVDFDLPLYLDAGISVVSVEYRFVQKAVAAGVQPPVTWPVHDAARAIQFVRSKAGEWNLDKTRIAATGGSAGACSSLWLAFHNDLADPTSADPVSRESTRLWTAAVTGAQTSLDPLLLKGWTPNSRYGGHAFGLFDPADLKTRDTRFAEFLEKREMFLEGIREYSPIEHVTLDDPRSTCTTALRPQWARNRQTRPIPPITGWASRRNAGRWGRSVSFNTPVPPEWSSLRSRPI